MRGAAAAAESEFAAEPLVRGPMAAGGNSERASTIVLYLQPSSQEHALLHERADTI